MGVLDGVEIGEGKGAILGVNVGCPIVTIGDFVTYMCKQESLAMLR